jgi:hypothetical protein
MKIEDHPTQDCESEEEPEGFPQFYSTESFAWWERMRWIYNLAVGLVGLSAILANANQFVTADMVGLVMYGLLANLFYTLGFYFEMADQHYFRGVLGLYKFRTLFFVAGSVGSMLLTLVTTLTYYEVFF